MKAMWRLIIAVMFMPALSACGFLGGMFEGDDEGPKPAELVDLDAELKIRQLWSSGIGDGVGEKFIKFRPAIEEETVYMVDVNGLLSAVDRGNGKKRWKRKLKEAISGGVGSGFGYLFLGTRDGRVIALSDKDGSEVWQANVSSEILSVPQTNGNVVLVQTSDEKIYAFDHETGAQRWFYESILPALTLRGNSNPTLTANVALVGLANGKLLALHADTGRELWEKRISVPQGRSELERMTDVDGDPLLQGEMVFATSFHGNVSAIELNTARLRWQKEISSYVGPDEGFGNLYVVDTDDHIHALDIKTGNSVWKQAQLDRRQLGAPVTFGNYLAVADFEGYLHVMSQLDGHFMARKKIDGEGVASIVAQGEVLYLYGNSGKVVSLKVVEK